MKSRPPSFLRALLLLLVAVGPLQAQTVFACAMMDTVVQDTCCCDGLEADPCTGANEPAPESGGPCCEVAVEISLDNETGQQPFKLTEVRSDPDPPPAMLPAPDAPFPPLASAGSGVFPRLPATDRSGSDTWLLTQRLRI